MIDFVVELALHGLWGLSKIGSDVANVLIPAGDTLGVTKSCYLIRNLCCQYRLGGVDEIGQDARVQQLEDFLQPLDELL